MELGKTSLTNIVLLKIVVSALLIGGISVMAKSYPYLSGYLAACPVVTFMSLTLLLLGKHSQGELSKFVTGALSGALLTALTLLLILLLSRYGLPAPVTVLLGGATWLLLAFFSSRLTF